MMTNKNIENFTKNYQNNLAVSYIFLDTHKSDRSYISEKPFNIQIL